VVRGPYSATREVTWSRPVAPIKPVFFGQTAHVVCCVLVVAQSKVYTSPQWLTSDDGSHRPVVVHDAASVEGVPADGILLSLVESSDLRVLLRRPLLDDLAILANIPHDVVGNDVHGELRVTKGVFGTFNSHKSGPESLGDLAASVKALDDDSTKLGI